MSVAMASARVGLYGIATPLLLVAWLAAWVLAGPGVVCKRRR